MNKNRIMKRIIFYPAFAFIVFSFASCADNDKVAVKETCEVFIEAIMKGDLTKARTMVTPETQEKWGNSAEFIDEVVRDRWESAKTKVSHVEVNGDQAQATLAIGIPSELAGEITILHLQKHGKVWFIHEPGFIIKEKIHPETVIMDAGEVK